MSHHVPNPPRRHQAEVDVLHVLQHERDAPDLTRRIMGRLGYMRSTPNSIRRARRQRAMRRASWGGALLLVVTASIQIHLHRSAMRSEAHVPLSHAVSHDLKDRQQRVTEVIRSLQRVFSAPVIESKIDGAISPEVDASAVGPIRWL